MIFVAISIVSLLAMAALAVDVVTLYVARSETQRTADAAALAAAKAIADSGFTSLPTTDPNYAPTQAVAQSLANASINAIIAPPINQVSGGSPSLTSPPSFDFSTHPGSYQVTVSLRRANLPTFFSKIWARNSAVVTATATAEAYNPANLTAITPIAPKNVKPWLVANRDPVTVGNPRFIDDLGSWAVDSAVIGQSFDLVSACTGLSTPCSPAPNPIRFPPFATTPQVEYVPAQVVPSASSVCPNSGSSCTSSCLGASDYELSIECADVNAYSYLNCGGGANLTWDSSINPGGASGPSAAGAACLIHATGPGPDTQSDTLDTSLWPPGPTKITGGTCSAVPGQLVTNSSSIVTIPVIADTSLSTGSTVTVVGFLQAFINQVDPAPGAPGQPPAGSIYITVVNIVGCSSTVNPVNPVIGVSGTSPIPVRLISPP